jgi:hypothetical protein
MKVVTIISMPEPLARHIVSGVRVAYNDVDGWTNIHVWSRGAGAGSFLVQIDDSFELVKRFLGSDLEKCQIEQEVHYQ